MDNSQDALPAAVNPVVRHQQAELHERAMNTLLWKIDLRIMPLAAVVNFFSFLDRINIGHARRFGLIDHLSLSKLEYKWASLIFFISYGLCTVPSTLLLRRFRPSKWIGILMFIWGIIIILMMFVYNLTSLLVARFFLGIAEAGAISGLYFYLSLWYIRKDQAFRMGIFVSGAVLGSVFDGILAYGIAQIGDAGSLTKWQWLCLVEGVATVCLAIVTYKFLADPSTVQWLNQCNKDILTVRLLADVKVIEDDNNESLYHQIRSICLDWKVWFYILIFIGSSTPVYSLNSFLPTIIEDMCCTNATNGTSATTELLTVPPYVVSFLTMLISSWNAGRLNERSNHIMTLFLIEISGYLYLILAKKHLYIGAMIAGTGVLCTNALILSWVTNNIVDLTKRAVGIALLISFGGVGAIVSEQIYRESDKALYEQGHWIVIGILCFTSILVLSLKLLLKYENWRRRNLTAAQCQAETVTGERQIQLNMHPDFVYVT